MSKTPNKAGGALTNQKIGMSVPQKHLYTYFLKLCEIDYHHYFDNSILILSQKLRRKTCGVILEILCSVCLSLRELWCSTSSF